LNRKVIGIVAAVVLVGGGFWWKSKTSATAGAGKTQYKLTAVDTGEVKKTVSATGTLQAWKVVDIKARAGGELAFLGVDVGSRVKKDEILARIDPLDVQLTLNNAKADEVSAKAREAQSGKNYQLQVLQSGISVKDAQAALLSAKANVKLAETRLQTAKLQSDAQPELTKSAIASAKANLDQALTNRRQLDATLQQQRASAKATLDQAVANRRNAGLNLERQKSLLEKGFVSQQAVDTAQANLDVTEASVQTARTKVDTIDMELKSTVEAADSRIAQTKAAYEQAQAGAVDVKNRENAVREAESSLLVSKAALARAEMTIEQSNAALINNDIRKFDIDANKATIARAKAGLFNAETSLARTIIRAPMDGVVLQKFAEQGTIIASALGMNSSGQNLLQIGDTSKMYVDVTVDETDIAAVEEGQNVDVAIEAYPGMPFEGKVIRIDPQAVVLQNVTSVHVRVEVDNSVPTFALLKPGMNATCEFVMEKTESAVRVPNEAVREDNDGKFVEIGEGGKTAPVDPKNPAAADPDALIDVKLKKVKVEPGVVGNDYTEIKSSDGNAVADGSKVVTQTIEPTPTTPGGGSPFGGGGMRGMGGGGGGRR
jgi:HlyD family secretion protein